MWRRERMLITFKLASLLLLPLMYTPTIQQLVNMTLPPFLPSVAACLREWDEANWWGAQISKISYCTRWCACMVLCSDKIAHIKHFKLKISSTWRFSSISRTKSIVESKKCSALSPIKGCELWDCVNRSDPKYQVTRAHVWKTKANLLESYKSESDEFRGWLAAWWRFREGFTLAHRAEGRCLPSKHVFRARKSFKQIFLPSPSPENREVEATTREN